MDSVLSLKKKKKDFGYSSFTVPFSMYIFTTCKQDYLYTLLCLFIFVYMCVYKYIYLCIYIKLLGRKLQKKKNTQPKIHQVSLQTNPYYEDLTSYQ